MLAKANLQSFLSAPVKAQLISGDVRVAQLWNGDTAQAAAENDQIAFVLPKEGGSIWLDAMVMPKTAPNKKAAHAFLNYVLRPEVGAAISNATGYGTPNEKAAPLLARPVPFPTPEEMAKLPPNMRVPMNCPRERAPLVAELDLDGRRVLRQEALPSGFARDGRATLYHRPVTTAGPHDIAVRLRDQAGTEDFNFRAATSVDLQPAQILVIDFEAARGAITLR